MEAIPTDSLSSSPRIAAVKDLLTPRQVARAIQVSESSVKRWCDKGVIPTTYTPGGHRRITLSAFVDFLRGSKYELADPEVVGMPATSGQTNWVLDRAAENLTELLVAGDQEKCRAVLLDLFLAEHSLTTICDAVIAPAFERIGDRWECGEAEVYQERRACEIMLRALHEFHSFIPPHNKKAPLAIGAAPAGNLGTTMAELVLRECGWQAVSLGDNLPFDTLQAAIGALHPRLFWLSCSHVVDADAFLSGYDALFQEFADDVAIVVGGRALTDESLRREMQYSSYGDSMRHLESFAHTVFIAPADKSA